MKKQWSIDELNNELWQYFDKKKYENGLKDIQVKYISELLSGQDVFALMPTGSGKSICYQLAGILTPGTTVVISPLVALIQQQTQELNKNGIPSVCIFREEYEEENDNDNENSFNISEWYQRNGWKNRKTAYREAASGRVKFLFVTPERFRSAHFTVLLRYLKVSLLILDEVHCMSIWGHEFRHSYLEILRTIRLLPKRPVIGAFTATATNAVREDIIQLLGLKLPVDYFKNVGNTIREELKFKKYVIKESEKTRDFFELHSKDKIEDLSPLDKKTFYELEWTDKGQILFRIIKKHKNECGIVFCSTLANVDIVYDKLKNKYGDKVLKYTGQMNKKDKNKSYRAFLSDKDSIMVATNAFGMGIDKSDIRFVIHYNCPNCLENYYQEAGRGGRDGRNADCYLLFSWRFDIRKNDYYSDNQRFKGYRYLSDISRNNKMIDYIYDKKESAKYIDNYFNQEKMKTETERVLEKLEREMIEEELRMPSILHVNRTKIAENMRKGIYHAGFFEEKPVSVSKNISKKSANPGDGKSLVSYKLSYEERPGEWVEYEETDEENRLTYFDMMVADAVYTLMFYKKPVCAKNIFVMLSGNRWVMITKNKKELIEKSIRKMMKTKITIVPKIIKSQGIWYEPLCKIDEQFLPLDEPVKGTAGAFRTREKNIIINEPLMDKKGCLTAKNKSRKIVIMPPLYRFAEGLLQFYSFPISCLNMEGEDWILKKYPGLLSKYKKYMSDVFTESKGKLSCNKEEFLSELKKIDYEPEKHLKILPILLKMLYLRIFLCAGLIPWLRKKE